MQEKLNLFHKYGDLSPAFALDSLIQEYHFSLYNCSKFECTNTYSDYNLTVVIVLIILNLLTFSRTFVGVSLLYKISLPFYTFACVTDLIDGYLARKFNAQSAFGTVFDQIADKILCWCACIAICKSQPYFAIPSGLMMLRDILISVIRLRNYIPTTQISRFKTWLSMIGLWFVLTNYIDLVSCCMFFEIGVIMFCVSVLVGWVELLYKIAK